MSPREKVPDVVKSLGNRAVRAFECNWLSAPPGVSPTDYAKVVEWMMDDYRLQLREVQKRMLTLPVKWGEEISEGETEGLTLDKKREKRMTDISERLGMRRAVFSPAGPKQSTSSGSSVSAGYASTVSTLVSSPSSRQINSAASRASADVAAASRYSSDHALIRNHPHGEERVAQQSPPTLRRSSSDTARSVYTEREVRNWTKQTRYSPRREAKPVSSTTDISTSSKRQTALSSTNPCQFDSDDDETDEVQDDDFDVPDRQLQQKSLKRRRAGASGVKEGQMVALAEEQHRNNCSGGDRERKKGGLKTGDENRKQLPPGMAKLKRKSKLTILSDEEEVEADTVTDGAR